MDYSKAVHMSGDKVKKNDESFTYSFTERMMDESWVLLHDNHLSL